MNSPNEDDSSAEGTEKPPLGRRRFQQIPPPPASWPAAARITKGGTTTTCQNGNPSSSTTVAGVLPSVSPLPPGFDEDMEVLLPGREASFFVRIARRELAATNGVVVVIHGGGFTGMSWAPATGVMKRDCCVLAPDLRGHGLTSSASSKDDATDNDDETNALMSLENLAEDVVSLLVEVFTSGLLRPQQPLRKTTSATAGSTINTTTTTNTVAVAVGEGGGDAAGHGTAVDEEKAGSVSRVRLSQNSSVPEGGGEEIASAATLAAPTDADVDAAAAAAIAAAASGTSRAQGTRDSGDDGGGGVLLVESESAIREAQLGGASSSGGAGGESGSASSLYGKYNAGRSDDGARGGGSPIGVGVGVVEEVHPAPAARDSAGEKAGGAACTKILLVGHSLGGSIAVRMAGAADEFKRRCNGAAEIAGVVAVDVVEGTALAALDDMPEVLRKIPRSFSSMEAAVLWHVKTGAVRNSASASEVVPSRLKDDGGRVVWRTDLRATERHWRGWFEGMSKTFLALPVPKLLVVAGMDRLDTDLTAAHMQGRFQLKLVYGCGHSVQEDQPEETAASIMHFAFRNSIIRRGADGGVSDAGRRGEEEELRLKLARARRQT